MPSLATLPYEYFIGVRYISLLNYILITVAVYKYCINCGVEKLAASILIILVAVSVSAIYIYIAQKIGLWEPLRTRMGTGGQDFTTTEVSFQYAFHRALGTFQEPSHLAQWMLAPLLMASALYMRYRRGAILVVIMIALSVLVLTGSLLGIIGFALGIMSIAIFSRNTRKIMLASIATSIWVGLFLTSYMFSIDYIGTIMPRLEELGSGVQNTNRSYVWWYLIESSPKIIGYGIGNSNIVLSEYLKNIMISSHLNLFVNIIYSLGVVGFAMIGLFMAYPFLAYINCRELSKDYMFIGCVAGHVAWIVCYFGNAEELNIIHGVCIGMLWARVRIKNAGAYINTCDDRRYAIRQR
ncbi:O-antigen ligase family protein [Blastochloris sulfoviridis]|nr:O-antigen ligase family protein [Blastochloris sulfoviridis]